MKKSFSTSTSSTGTPLCPILLFQNISSSYFSAQDACTPRPQPEQQQGTTPPLRRHSWQTRERRCSPRCEMSTQYRGSSVLARRPSYGLW